MMHLQSQLQNQRTQIAAQNAIMNLQDQALVQDGVSRDTLALYRAALQHCTNKTLNLESTVELQQKEIESLKSAAKDAEHRSSQLLQQQRTASAAQAAASESAAAVELQRQLHSQREKLHRDFEQQKQRRSSELQALNTLVTALAQQYAHITSNDRDSMQYIMTQKLDDYSRRLSFVTQRCGVIQTLQQRRSRPIALSLSATGRRSRPIDSLEASGRLTADELDDASPPLDSQQQSIDVLQRELAQSHTDRQALLNQLVNTRQERDQLHESLNQFDRLHRAEIESLNRRLNDATIEQSSLQRKYDEFAHAHAIELESQHRSLEADFSHRLNELTDRLTIAQRHNETLKRELAETEIQLRTEQRVNSRLKDDAHNPAQRLAESQRIAEQRHVSMPALGASQSSAWLQATINSQAQRSTAHLSSTSTPIRINSVQTAVDHFSSTQPQSQPTPSSMRPAPLLSAEIQHKLASLASLSSQLLQEEDEV